MSCYKFNESQREQTVLKRLKQGEIVALISEAGTLCVSDPGMDLVILQAICTRYGLTIGANFIWLVRVLMIIFYPIAWVENHIVGAPCGVMDQVT
nr:putative duf21 domain-containing protein [Quercus suber]